MLRYTVYNRDWSCCTAALFRTHGVQFGCSIVAGSDISETADNETPFRQVNSLSANHDLSSADETGSL